MARKSVVKMSQINNFFSNHNYMKGVERGENAFQSGHVLSMTYTPEDKIIQGYIKPSMKEASSKYLVKILLAEKGDIKEASCKCPRGTVLCHHMAALLYYAHYNISITDKACSWSKKESKRKLETNKAVSELFPTKPYKAVTIPDINNVKKELFEGLQKKNKTLGFSWLLSPEPLQSENTSIPGMEDIIFSVEFKTCNNKENFLEEHCFLTMDKIENISVETVGQSANWKWTKLRKFRLTASHFGLVLKAMKRQKFPDSLYKTILGEYNLDGVKAVQWGKQMESTACTAFEKMTQLRTSETGLWIHPKGLFGATPDKIVHFADGTKGTVEIKCPYKYRENILSEVLQKDKNYIVTRNASGSYVINKEHNYYHQIQGQLHLVNCKVGFLVLWTRKETLVFQIEKENSWAMHFSTLKKFYFEQFLDHILNKKK